MRRILAGVGVGLAAAAVLAGSNVRPVAAQDDASKPAYYTEKVRPILQQNCGGCHLGNNSRGGLSLATKAGTMKGGMDGIIVVPGDVNSLIVKLIRHEGPADNPMPMPPNGKLSDEDVAVVTRWVKAGAVMPDDTAASMAAAAGMGGGGGGQRYRTPTMTLGPARTMSAAVEAAATKKREHVAICIMDSNGDIVLSVRMDGLANATPIGTAQGKARAVLMFGIPTGVLADATAARKPLPQIVELPQNGATISTMRGGLPIYKDGKMIGSIGVGGSETDQDEPLSELGVEAAGFTSKP
jgi:cytochrome c